MGVSPSDATAVAVEALRGEVAAAARELDALRIRLAATRRSIDELTARQRGELVSRTQIAGPRPRLFSDGIVLEGSAVDRAAVRRITVGEPVERQFDRWMGVSRCASTAADVRQLWDHLLAWEERCGGGILRGAPSTVLDIPRATVRRETAGQLTVALRDAKSTLAASTGGAANGSSVLAVPRFAYDMPTRKVLNFGHWLLDCVPHLVALSAVAPDTRFLIQESPRPFHLSTLALFGITKDRLVAWDGSPVSSERVLVLESDGKAAGGRPLSPLLETRRLLRPKAESAKGSTRRVYVSRRDARKKRRWIMNQKAVEALFRSRGFDVLVMSECPLDEQVRIFREAAIVAGPIGAGLTNLIFAAPGTHAIVLLTESAFRWHAKEGTARSFWATDARAADNQLSAFGDSPRFYAYVAAAFEQVCHTFVAADEMPLDLLSAFLDDVLSAVASA